MILIVYGIYKERLKYFLQQIDVREEAILCQDKCCENMDYKIAVDNYCANLIHMCIMLERSVYPKSKESKSTKLIGLN